MPIAITAARSIRVGEPEHVQGNAPEGRYSAVFEDDGETGYFYALDFGGGGQPIQNAVHIYNVADVSDKHRPSTIEIGWSPDSAKVVLLINDYPHAVFDFASKRGFCRTGFPSPAQGSGWLGHEWSDDSLELFGRPS
jgi:hypothetical protein